MIIDDKLSGTILLYLHKVKRNSCINSSTIQQIMENIDMDVKNKTHYRKVYHAVQILLNGNLLEPGLKIGRYKTYFLTENGFKEVELLRKEIGK